MCASAQMIKGVWVKIQIENRLMCDEIEFLIDSNAPEINLISDLILFVLFFVEDTTSHSMNILLKSLDSIVPEQPDW